MANIVSIDYSDMRDAERYLNNAVNNCDSYIRKIDKTICDNLAGLEKGSTKNTNDANYFAKQKIKQLQAKRDEMESYSKNINSARKFAEETDKNVSSYIKQASNDFRKANDMNVNVITEFFTWFTTNALNSTGFGRWLNQVFKDVGTWIDSAKRNFKNWYELEGGKYIIKTVLAVVGTIIAVIFLVCVAWPALIDVFAALTCSAAVWTLITAVAGVVGAVIAVADGVVKVVNNVRAVQSFSEDPGWAKRYNGFSSLSKYLRENNFKSNYLDKISGDIANGIELVEIAVAIINFADLAKTGVQKFRTLKSDGYLRYFNKIRFKTKNGKVTISTIKYGIRNIWRNAGEFKKLFTTTNIARINESYESGLKFYKGLKNVKNVIKVVERVGDDGLLKHLLDVGADHSTGHSYGDTLKEMIENIIDHHKHRQGLLPGILGSEIYYK